MSKYYHCKERDSKLFEKMRISYLPPEKIIMISHVWHTQTNETMNTLVASYTPKTKNFCKTMSLETRVGISAGVMIARYAKLWQMIYEELGLESATHLKMPGLRQK